jgi:hypothetical protein
MKRSVVVACALTLVALSAGGDAAQSQDTGIAKIHPWVKIGRKTCMLDHFHYGSGNRPTRAQAERVAIRSWAEFTAWEYGDPWGRYSIAVSKKMTCSPGSGGWSCAVEARPCRQY